MADFRKWLLAFAAAALMFGLGSFGVRTRSNRLCLPGHGRQSEYRTSRRRHGAGWRLGSELHGRRAYGRWRADSAVQRFRFL